jgi:Uncharacterized conserved protein
LARTASPHRKRKNHRLANLSATTITATKPFLHFHRIQLISRAHHRSGQLNAKQRELAELQAMAQRRLKGARKNFDDGMQAARESRRDVDYIKGKTA